MRYLKYMALVAVMMVPLAYSQAQVRVGVGIGVGPVGVAVGPAYVGGPPVCAYGYYPDYPYGCAPYGYYGPSYFVDGVFIGAGPWYHFGHPAWFWNRGVYGRAGWGWAGRPGYVARGAYDRGYARGFARGGMHIDNGFHGGAVRGGGGFARGGMHADNGFHGGAVRGGGGSHGGFRR